MYKTLFEKGLAVTSATDGWMAIKNMDYRWWVFMVVMNEIFVKKFWQVIVLNRTEKWSRQHVTFSIHVNCLWDYYQWIHKDREQGNLVKV